MIVKRIIQEIFKMPFRLVNTGNAPAISDRVVSPKEKPGFPCKVLEIATRVIGIVILNRKIPKIPNKGLLLPKARSKEDKIKEVTPTFIQPNLSANIPPSAFPKNTPEVNKISNKKFVLNGKTITKPIKARIATDKRSNIIINSR